MTIADTIEHALYVVDETWGRTSESENQVRARQVAEAVHALCDEYDTITLNNTRYLLVPAPGDAT